MPEPLAADIINGSPKPSRLKSAVSDLWRKLSALLATKIVFSLKLGADLMNFVNSLSSGSSPDLLSTIKIIISAFSN